jgi:hypothetical protein
MSVQSAASAVEFRACSAGMAASGGYKLAAKISGCWRTLATLQRHCRIRSCLATARSQARHPFAAIRDALTGNAWMPPHPA